MLDADRKIRYQGRIDDQFAVGALRNAADRDYLKSAIDELLAGQEVQVPVTEPVGCQIGRVLEPKADAQVTYAKQVSRILQANCVECHREGQIAPFALTDYEEVAGWAPMIREVVSENRMPPWHADPQHGTFANDRSLSEQDRELIYQWVDDGAPLGDLADLPEPATFVTGWQLPREPDLVVTINAEPFEVKAEGEVRYQWFTVDPGLKEDKWLAGAEIVPGNRAVVHHILAFVKEPGEKRRFTEGEGFLVSYVPGLRAEPFPSGMAKCIPPGLGTGLPGALHAGGLDPVRPEQDGAALHREDQPHPSRADDPGDQRGVRDPAAGFKPRGAGHLGESASRPAVAFDDAPHAPAGQGLQVRG